MNDWTTSLALSKTPNNFSPFSFDTLILIPNNTENTINATILLLVNNDEKSPTLIVSIVLARKLTFSLVASSPKFSTSFIASIFLTSTNLNALVVTTPTNTLTKDVTINTAIIVPNILPTLFGYFILPIDVLIVKKISGTIITSNIFKNKSPKGLRTVAFSLKTNPTIVPIIIEPNNINVDL